MKRRMDLKLEKIVFSLFIFLVEVFLAAQDIDGGMALMGVAYEEDIGAVQVEEMHDLASRPLRLNSMSRSRLSSSGLFTPYQIAALSDYRERNGDILSFTELVAIDGFGESFVRKAAEFISLESDMQPGRAECNSLYMRNTLITKFSTKIPIDASSVETKPSFGYGMKYRFAVNDVIEAGFTARTTYSGALLPPESSSLYLVYNGRRVLETLILGDFNARFGQGLAMWSGFTMSGIPSAGTFSKRAAGLSPSWSYSGDSGHRGVAADFRAGDFLVSAFISSPEWRKSVFWKLPAELTVLPGLNVYWLGMNGQVSLTCFAQSRMLSPKRKDSPFFETCYLSADGRYTVRGMELFAEVASEIYSGTVAALVGCRKYLFDALDLAAALRYYPAGYKSSFSGALKGGSKCSNEYGMSVSASVSAGRYVGLKGHSGFGSSVKRHTSDLRVDALYSPEKKQGTAGPSRQIKVLFSHSWQVSSCFSLLLRLSERVRSYGKKYRTDLRCDFRYSDGMFLASARVNCLKCVGLGLLGYLEGGWKTERFHFWLRGGAFRVDNWDDRIYAYERDAPGNFSVPAYYGRGFWCAANCGVRLPAGFKIYLRGSYVGYPWLSPGMKKKKPGRAELKIQITADIHSLIRPLGS